MLLTPQQKQQIVDDGFVVLPAVVPRALLDDALRAINASVGDGMNRDEMPSFRTLSFCPELREQPVIRDLFAATPLRETCEELLGVGNARYGGGQIALRFPLPLGFPTEKARLGWHLDGVPFPNNGVAPGTLGSFTMLIGVLLSDLPHENSGNFTVWPGSHRVLETHFQHYETEEATEKLYESDMGAPRQITGKAGDVVLCHYQIAHGVAPNWSPHVRYAIFFRVKHPRHDELKPQQLRDLWLEWNVANDE